MPLSFIYNIFHTFSTVFVVDFERANLKIVVVIARKYLKLNCFRLDNRPESSTNFSFLVYFMLLMTEVVICRCSTE